jgi:tRNA(Ile)-lysidine synthase
VELEARLLAEAHWPPAGSHVHVAVSGGADSLGLWLLAERASLVVTVHHVHHHLREAADGDAAYVEELARRRGVAMVRHDVVVPAGPNLEARARSARRSVLPVGTLTGHTMDDLAETIMLNLLRGAGVDGLTPMVDDPTKPLLGVRRSDLATYVVACGLTPRVDETNADRSLRRNDVRARLLPLCNEVADRDVVPILARQAALMAEDRAWLDDLVHAEARTLGEVDCRELRTWPVAMQRRWFRRELRHEDHDGEHPPTADDVARALAVAAGTAVATDLSGGRRLRRSDQHLTLLPLPLDP